MRVGILGGGQLGQMLAKAGKKLGHSFTFLDASHTACASSEGRLIVGSMHDPTALQVLLEASDVITYESENISLKSVEILEDQIRVLPHKLALKICQDRLLEKELCRKLSIPTANFSPINSFDDLSSHTQSIGFPSILKSRTMGYDGKGQVAFYEESDLSKAEPLCKQPCIVEKRISFTRELSIIASRDMHGNIAWYPLTENVHKEGILRISRAPADVSTSLTDAARSIAKKMLEHFDYVGTMTIELFEALDGTLLVNELAPRVHNSGHWTIEGSQTSQFENHIRCITGQPVGSTENIGYSAMINVIGSAPPLDALREMDGVHVHMYGKEEVPNRKLGHITISHADKDYIESIITKARSLFEI